MGKVFKVGTRTSPLALRQLEEVLEPLREAYPEAEVGIVKIETRGDKDSLTPISKMEGTDFFTKEIDDALLNGKIDFAVHSAKDLPDELPEGLVIAAITSSVDPYDVLVSKDGLTLSELPEGARVGTSSSRRKSQLKKCRPDVEIVDLRGNIEKRLEKLYETDMDAILIAAAGLIRLGLEDKITERLSFEVMRPHPLQGALAVVARKGDAELLDILNVLNKKEEVNEGQS